MRRTIISFLSKSENLLLRNFVIYSRYAPNAGSFDQKRTKDWIRGLEAVLQSQVSPNLSTPLWCRNYVKHEANYAKIYALEK